MKSHLTAVILSGMLGLSTLHAQSILPLVDKTPADLSPVPEPSTWALIAAGLLMTVAFRALSKKRRV